MYKYKKYIIPNFSQIVFLIALNYNMIIMLHYTVRELKGTVDQLSPPVSELIFLYAFV